MRVVAGSALAILDRLVFNLGLRELLRNIFMTLATELAARLEQQLLVIRRVRVMAGSAFTILGRLVLHLRFRELLLDVFMALHAEFAVRFE